jgi:flagellin
LSSGFRVKSPNDNAVAFFAAQALSGRAAELTQAKDNVDQAISGLVDQANSLANSARSTNDPGQRAAFAAQFDEVRGQIDSLAADASFGGSNLLGSGSNDQTVALNEDGSSSLTIQNTDSTSAGLGLAASNGFAYDADIDAALANTSSARSTLRTSAETLGSNSSVLQTRIDSTQQLTNTLEGAAAGLTLADLTEESANRLAVQTQQQLGTNSLSLAANSQQSVLSLIG